MSTAANRIDTRFTQLRLEGRKAFVAFLTAGDPDHEISKELVAALPQAGADIIEIGMPFTDPMADGPAIQASSLRALANGASMVRTFDIVSHVRAKDTQVPVVLMGYLNPIEQFGYEKFMREAAKRGVDGLIIVDLPPEEDEAVYALARDAGIHIVKLITPTTTPERLDVILERSGGFLYYVSITGVTGTASADKEKVASQIAMIKARTELPVAVGFGIKSADDVRDFARIADAVVVGSALVRATEVSPDPAILAQTVKALAAPLALADA